MTPVVRRLTPVPLAVVALAGCGGGPTPAGPVVLAAERVFTEAPVVVPDPSGASATPQVATAIDMACAVVFGREESLGDGIATDADMGGGAHTEHRAVMRGVEPGTEHFYRVRGSGTDGRGRLYRSELMTFRTPEAEAAEVPGEDVALGAEVVDVSSEFSGPSPRGTPSTVIWAREWSSDGTVTTRRSPSTWGGPSTWWGWPCAAGR
ncbi:fibronectin type III domain-containing protein [Blastococcus sp. SYSU DS0533]